MNKICMWRRIKQVSIEHISQQVAAY